MNIYDDYPTIFFCLCETNIEFVIQDAKNPWLINFVEIYLEFPAILYPLFFCLHNKYQIRNERSQTYYLVNETNNSAQTLQKVNSVKIRCKLMSKLILQNTAMRIHKID